MIADLSQIASLKPGRDPAIDYTYKRFQGEKPSKRHWGKLILRRIVDEFDTQKFELARNLHACKTESPEYSELQERYEQNSQILQVLAHGLLPLLAATEYSHPNRRLLGKLYLNAIKLIRQYQQYPSQGAS